LKAYREPLFDRSRDGSGVFLVYSEGKPYSVAVWQYEDKQVKRMFSHSQYGLELSMAVAYMAREIGILVEQDRLNTTL
jgi:hypothetical protein